MALDQFFALNMHSGSCPILRFYGWNPFCLSLGFHQKSDDVDIDKIKDGGYQIVRRPTGGSAIFHSDELTYSLIVPGNTLRHQDIYNTFHLLLANAFNELGLQVSLSKNDDNTSYLNKGQKSFACFNRSAYSEIQHNGKKVVGSAQKIYPNAILQHGSIMLGAKHEKIASFMKIDDSQKLKYIELLRNNSTSLTKITDNRIKESQIEDALIRQIELHEKYRMFFQYVSNDEIEKSKAYDKLFKI
ncbi:MAG: hypothetical protein AB7T22_02010 [Calditrichaceae bacterium]